MQSDTDMPLTHLPAPGTHFPPWVQRPELQAPPELILGARHGGGGDGGGGSGGGGGGGGGGNGESAAVPMSPSAFADGVPMSPSAFYGAPPDTLQGAGGVKEIHGYGHVDSICAWAVRRPSTAAPR